MEIPTFTKIWHNTTYPSIDPSNPTLSAKGKVIVITGGGSGIGKSIAKSFAKANASSIVILGRTEKSLASTKSEIEATHEIVNVSTYVADVSDAEAIDEAFASIKSQFGAVDVFINNAGYLPELKPVAEASFDEWWKGFKVNVEGSFNATKAFLGVASSDAVIINVTTGMVHIGAVPGYSSYVPSKLASAKFFENVQAENPGIRVVNVSPGVILTEMGLKVKAAGIE